MKKATLTLLAIALSGCAMSYKMDPSSLWSGDGQSVEQARTNDALANAIMKLDAKVKSLEPQSVKEKK